MPHCSSARPIGAGRLVVHVGTIGSSTSSATGVDAATGAVRWTREQAPTAVVGTTATTALEVHPGCVPAAASDTKTG